MCSMVRRCAFATLCSFGMAVGMLCDLRADSQQAYICTSGYTSCACTNNTPPFCTFCGGGQSNAWVHFCGPYDPNWSCDPNQVQITCPCIVYYGSGCPSCTLGSRYGVAAPVFANTCVYPP